MIVLLAFVLESQLLRGWAAPPKGEGLCVGAPKYPPSEGGPEPNGLGARNARTPEAERGGSKEGWTGAPKLAGAESNPPKKGEEDLGQSEASQKERKRERATRRDRQK